MQWSRSVDAMNKPECLTLCCVQAPAAAGLILTPTESASSPDWGSEPQRLQWKSLHISVSTSTRPVRPWERTSGGWMEPRPVQGLHGLSFSLKQELCYHRASVLFSSCSGRSKKRFRVMAKILKKEGGSCANTGSSSEPAVFSGVNVRSLVNRHVSALRMCCSSAQIPDILGFKKIPFHCC